MDLGFDSDFALKVHLTPGGPEHVLLSPWGTVVKTWIEEPPLHHVRRYAIMWRATHPEDSRPEEPVEVQRTLLDRFRNRLASALWVR